jgi:hypothetical protein
MKSLKLPILILSCLAMALFAIIAFSVTEYENDTLTVKYVEKSPKILISNQLLFNLKYKNYLIPYPYTYEYKGKTRNFRFLEMIETARVSASEFERGSLTYVSNYKDEHGLAPLYRGKTVDKSGTLRGASAPAYKDLNNLDEFDYLPDGTLIRIIEESAAEKEGFSKVYCIKDKCEYFISQQYVELNRKLTKVEKVIVVDLGNQTIISLENKPLLEFFKASNTYLKTDWEIVSYSKCTTGDLSLYHQPTPEGYFYAIEKKPFFYYLADGTNIVAGKEPWGIRFTAGAYVHGMSLGEYSSAIGTIPLSHKCVRNYTSHAKFLYDWYEEDRTIITVIN